jgi:hypothetical protein
VAGNEEVWTVYFHADAVRDFESVKSKGDRVAVLHSIEKLRYRGPTLSSPYMKSLKGEPDLFELRPKSGATPMRPIYSRVGSTFVILAVAPDKKRLSRAIRDARGRLARLLDVR